MTEIEKRNSRAEQIRIGKAAKEGTVQKLREDGLSYTEIAAKLNISEATVRFIDKKFSK